MALSLLDELMIRSHNKKARQALRELCEDANRKAQESKQDKKKSK